MTTSKASKPAVKIVARKTTNVLSPATSPLPRSGTSLSTALLVCALTILREFLRAGANSKIAIRCPPALLLEAA